MGQFDNWAHRQVRQAMWVKKQREARAMISQKDLVTKQKQYELRNWAKLNPEMAKYDNDGNPIESN